MVCGAGRGVDAYKASVGSCLDVVQCGAARQDEEKYALGQQGNKLASTCSTSSAPNPSDTPRVALETGEGLVRADGT